MMYIIFTILLTAALLWLTVLSSRACRSGPQESLLRMGILNGAIAAIGILLIGMAAVITRVRIFDNAFSAEWQSWAWDTVVLYWKWSVPICMILLCLIALSVLTTAFSKKAQWVVRQAAGVTSALFLLLIALFFTAIAKTDVLPLDVYLFVFGVGEAFLLRLPDAIELLIKWRNHK